MGSQTNKRAPNRLQAAKRRCKQRLTLLKPHFFLGVAGVVLQCVNLDLVPDDLLVLIVRGVLELFLWLSVLLVFVLQERAGSRFALGPV